MPTHTKHLEFNCFYFCTLTCLDWLPLFEKTNLYSNIEDWFRMINQFDLYVNSYVIMPNHLHFVVYRKTDKHDFNKVIANGKRFWAYEIVKRLKANEELALLQKLKDGVEPNEITKGKKHKVFRLSFDAKECFDIKMLEQKIDYIHHNPVSGKWNLVHDFTEYKYSSAGYYENEMAKPNFLFDYRDFV